MQEFLVFLKGSDKPVSVFGTVMNARESVVYIMNGQLPVAVFTMAELIGVIDKSALTKEQK